MRGAFFSRRYLLSLYSVFVLDGVAQVVAPSQAAVSMLLNVMVASSAALWALADSSRRGRTLAHSVQLVVFLLWPIALPTYLIGARGWRGLGLTLLHAVGLCVTFSAFFIAASWLAYRLTAR